MAALQSQHAAAVEGLKGQAATRESQLQASVSKAEGAIAALTKTKESLEADGQVGAAGRRASR